MKIGIYGSVDSGLVKDKQIEYIGVDQGVIHLLHQNITPLIAIGDMDSIEDIKVLDNLNLKRLSEIKDDTDTGIAIEYAIEKGYHNIDLYGVTQNRMDHFMVIIALLEKYQDYHIVVYDRINKIQVLKAGLHKINKEEYKYFSLFAFSESYISLSHCHYPLDHYHLMRNDPLCVSNQMNDDYALIENSHPVLLILTL